MDIETQPTILRTSCQNFTQFLDIAKGDGKYMSLVFISDNGMYIRTFAHQSIIEMLLGSDIFTEIECQTSVFGMFSVTEISKRIGKCNRQMLKYIVFSQTPGEPHMDLNILDEHKEIVSSHQFIPKELTQDMSPVQPHDHKLMLMLSSQDLLLALDGMPSVFSIQLCLDAKKIEFKGTSRMNTTTVCCIPLSDNACREIETHPMIRDYKENFTRRSILSVIRACRIQSTVYLGLTVNMPPTFHIYVSEHLLSAPSSPSYVQITVEPHIDTVAKLLTMKPSRKRPFQSLAPGLS